MNPLADIAGAYVRWRHSRGYGVHSPFAYRIVCDAVSPGPYGFYGYDLIDRVLLAPGAAPAPRLRADARFLLRLIVALGAARLVMPDCAHPAFRAAAEGAGATVLAFPAAPPAPLPSDLLLAPRALVAEDDAARWVEAGGALLFLGGSPALAGRLRRDMPCGLLMAGKRKLLAVARPDMAFTFYSMRF